MGVGENRLLGAANPLIALIGRLRSSVSSPNVPRVRQQAIKAAREFQSRLQKLDYSQDELQRASYILCTAVDQAVLSTPWGYQSEFSTQGLLITFHREAWGGKRFFDILEKASADPAPHIDLLELQYVCLSLGFAGQYQEAANGAGKLLEIREDLYRRIRNVRGTPEEQLSIRWQGESDRRNKVIRYVPLWVIAVIAATVAVGFFLVYAFLLHGVAEPIRREFAGLAASHPDYARRTEPVSAKSLTLKQLLRPQIDAKVLTVEETDKQTMVSLVSDDIFKSGSATLNSVHGETIRAAALALNQVPGKVLVIGHTDDQPIRSLRFADNIELSRARATAVKDLLAATMSEPGRVSWLGLGSSAPKCTPPDTPDNRACNRRVEIVLHNN
jgi:type VI secretion system protein ImpK